MLKSYADRPATPLGTVTGLTSTPCSQHPSRCGTPIAKAKFNPYMYQPAMMWNHPDCYGPYGGSSSNYLSALRGKVVAKVAAEMPEEGKEVESPRDVTPNDVGVKNVVL